MLRQEAALGRLSGKLIDALEPLVLSGRLGRPPVAGRPGEGGAGLQPDTKPEDPEDDPSSPGGRRLAVAATRPALTL